jgi:hypothetical protein
MKYINKQLLDLMGQPIKLNALRTVKMYQKRSLRAPTKSELAFMRLMGPLYKATKITYIKQPIWYITEGISFRSDFVFRKFKLIVEIDGYSHSKTKEVDIWRDRVLNELANMTTIRFTNEEVTNRFMLVRMKVLNNLINSQYGDSSYKKRLFNFMKDQQYHPVYLTQLKEYQSQVSV